MSTLTRLNYTKTIPSVPYISNHITQFAPMVLPHICAVIDVISGVGNPNLDPALRENKFVSFFALFSFFSDVNLFSIFILYDVDLNILLVEY